MQRIFTKPLDLNIVVPDEKLEEFRQIPYQQFLTRVIELQGFAVCGAHGRLAVLNAIANDPKLKGFIKSMRSRLLFNMTVEEAMWVCISGSRGSNGGGSWSSSTHPVNH